MARDDDEPAKALAVSGAAAEGIIKASSDGSDRRRKKSYTAS